MAENGSPIKRYLLKEYGSWGVMVMSYVTGLIAAKQVNLSAVAAFLSIALLINSKQALTIWLRSSSENRLYPLLVFSMQALSGLALLLPLAGLDAFALLPYAIIPAAYLVCLGLLGEHAIYTEVIGFILLSLSSVVARFAADGEVDPGLFAAVALFFAAGVFRVRIQFKKEMAYRIFMIVYVAVAAAVYQITGLPVYLILPLVDNLVFSISLYRVGLSATGWIEMAKGIIFICLMAYGYR